MNAPSDRSLLRAYRRGNDSAARSLYAQTAPGLIVYARSILRDQALAEDVVQSVFCKILTMPGREVRRVEHVRAWLARLVRNEAISMVRSSDRRALREDRAAASAPSDARRSSAERDELRRAVDQLDGPRREIVLLKCALGLSIDQIAQTVDINRNTAASRYREALTQLRGILGAHTSATASTEVTSHA